MFRAQLYFAVIAFHPWTSILKLYHPNFFIPRNRTLLLYIYSDFDSIKYNTTEQFSFNVSRSNAYRVNGIDNVQYKYKHIRIFQKFIWDFIGFVGYYYLFEITSSS